MSAATAKDSGYALTTPCANCPFRTDVARYLMFERAQEIGEALRDSGEFPCHKTVTHDDDSEWVRTGREQQCAGALILMENDRQPGQLVRIAERLGMYDPTRLDRDAPVYESISAWVRSYGDPVPTVTTDDGEVLEFEHCGVVGDDCEDPPGWGGSGGVRENDDEPTCNPLEGCYHCGNPMCSACSTERDGKPWCVNCIEDEERWSE